MRLSFKVLLGVIVVLLVVQLSPVSALKASRTQNTELSALFRDADGDKIRSDGKKDSYGNPVPYTSNRITASYPNDVLLYPSGNLYIRIQKNRDVVFKFDLRATSGSSSYPRPDRTVECHEYAPYDGDPGKFFTEPVPAFLSGDGIVDALLNDITVITTSGSVSWTGSEWAADATLPTIKTMGIGPDAPPLYVWLNVRFDTVLQDESFMALPDFDLWERVRTTGIARVTHPDAKTWVLEPLGAADPRGALGPNEASLSMIAVGNKTERHGGGYCDLGHWVMPFALTLTER